MHQGLDCFEPYTTDLTNESNQIFCLLVVAIDRTYSAKQKKIDWSCWIGTSMAYLASLSPLCVNFLHYVFAVDTSYVQKNESTCMIGYFCCDFCEDAILATASEKKLNVATEWSDTSFLMIDEKRKRRILHIDFESSRGTSYDITTLPLHLQAYINQKRTENKKHVSPGHLHCTTCSVHLGDKAYSYAPSDREFALEIPVLLS